MRADFDKAMAWVKTREGWKGDSPRATPTETICGSSTPLHPDDVKAMRSMK